MPVDNQKKPSMTIVLPLVREQDDVLAFCARLQQELSSSLSDLEILVAAGEVRTTSDSLPRGGCVRSIGADLGYAEAVKRGFAEAKNDLILTMDADGSHDPRYVLWMLTEISMCDMVIGSRYVRRGGQEASRFRRVTSRCLNWWIGKVCSMSIRDLTGGFRLYRRAVIEALELESKSFEIQTEIAIKAYGHGFRIREFPYSYHPRQRRGNLSELMSYGLAFLLRSLRLRRYRNSARFCDYDERAYSSRIPMQRWWQRKRYAKMMRSMEPEPQAKVLDIGCGSGRLILSWPQVVGLDYDLCALRYLAGEPRPLVHGSAEELPFAAESFDQVYSCEVLEHLPAETTAITEIARVTKPGGKVLITTPDYGRWTWPAVEWLYKKVVPAAYGHDHISKYTLELLEQKFAEVGLKVISHDRMFNSILIMVFEKTK